MLRRMSPMLFGVMSSSHSALCLGSLAAKFSVQLFDVSIRFPGISCIQNILHASRFGVSVVHDVVDVTYAILELYI